VDALIQPIPETLGKALKANLSPGETVELQIKGAFKEALVCSNRRLMIIKSGFMTGQMFGSDTFQLPWSGISSAEVKFRILSGYFEVSAGGMQNSLKRYWSSDRSTDPSKAPNCVALNSKSQAALFRLACSFILQKVDEARRAPVVTSPIQAAPASDMASQIERLWSLKTEGALTQAEFEAAKARLIT
jgi:hypothetical protein